MCLGVTHQAPLELASATSEVEATAGEEEKLNARRERQTRKTLIEPDSLLAQQIVCGGSMKTEEEDMSSVGDCFHRSMPPHTANHPDMTL